MNITSNFIDSYAARGIILDDFQIEAVEALAAGSDVLVSAPTGAGKTVVAEFAVELALATERRCIYTAPIKALSNQKYKDLSSRLGADIVGLLTGDVTINRDAPIVVVTTEVLRNMLFTQDAALRDLGYVVLDEVHYLADPSRGPVWEEVILQLPAHTRLVSLSATVANIGEFSSWLRSVRGPTTTVVSRHRPVPLRHYVAVGRKIIPMFAASDNLMSTLESAAPFRRMSPARRRGLLLDLESRGMLPAIEFIFSRKGCDNAVRDLLDDGVSFTSAAEEREIHSRLSDLRATLSEADAKAIRFGFWQRAFVNGFAAHHAGMFPALKELAEELMGDGLLKVVFATGTLALGVDMPVRTVVIDELRKWNGSDFEDLTATEYTQLIGRAGRRGKDDVGNVIIVGSSELDYDYLTELGSGAVDPLLSAFFPSYNTVVNLIAHHGYEAARAIMGTSFAQYQRDADLGQIEGRYARIEARIRDVETRLDEQFPGIDASGFVRLRGAAKRASKTKRRRAKAEYAERIERSFDAIETGHLYAFATAGELDYGVVLSIAADKVRVITALGDLIWLRLAALSSEMRDVGKIELPFGMSFKEPHVRELIADRIIAVIDERSELGVDRDLMGSWDRFAVAASPELARHPASNDPRVTEIIDAGQELASLEARRVELDELRGEFDDSVAREFDATASVLVKLGYLQRKDGKIVLGPTAGLLRGIHAESDLLIAMSLAEPAIEALSPAMFAGVISAFLSDRRLGTGMPFEPHMREAIRRIEVNVDYLLALESDAGIMRTTEPLAGGVEAFAVWADGGDLATVLHGGKLVVGDFIAASRRLLDLLGQLEVVGEGTWVKERAHIARELVRRWDWL